MGLNLFLLIRKKMNNDKQYLEWATIIAKQGTCGAVKVDKNGVFCAYSNDNGEYAYIRCIKDKFPYNDGSTLYLTHGVNSRNAMEIVDAGIKRVVFVKEFDIGVGTKLLRCMGVIVDQMEL